MMVGKPKDRQTEKGQMGANIIDILGCDPTTPRKHIQRNPLPKKDMSSFPSDGCNMFDRFERLTLLHMPFDSTCAQRNRFISRDGKGNDDDDGDGKPLTRNPAE